jgi:hypothetical protein
MQRLRTIGCFVRVLAALFVVAQFAGVVPSPVTTAQAGSSIAAAPVHHHHHHADQGAGTNSHSHESKNTKHQVDPCCGLHAFFTGVLPGAVVVDPVDVSDQRPSVRLDDVVVGIDPHRIDRPPRPSAVI